MYEWFNLCIGGFRWWLWVPGSGGILANRRNVKNRQVGLLPGFVSPAAFNHSPAPRVKGRKAIYAVCSVSRHVWGRFWLLGAAGPAGRVGRIRSVYGWFQLYGFFCRCRRSAGDRWWGCICLDAPFQSPSDNLTQCQTISVEQKGAQDVPPIYTRSANIIKWTISTFSKLSDLV